MARLPQILGRLSGGLLSQAVSMLTNAFMVIGLARSLDADSFGRVALVYGFLQFSIGLVRASAVEVYASHFAAEEPRAEIVGGLLRSAFVRLVALQVLCVFVGFFVSSRSFSLVVGLAFVLLPAGLTEVWRHLAFARLRPNIAAATDALWAIVGLLAVLLALRYSDLDAAPALVLGWGTGAVAATIGGWLLLGRPVVGGRSEEWVGLQRGNAAAYTMEFAVSRGTPEATSWLLAAFGAVADAGSFRLAQTLLGPLAILFASMRGLLIGELRQLAIKGSDILRAAARSSVVAFLVAPVYLGALLLVPDSVGESVVGPGWGPAILFVSYLAIRRAFSMASVPPFLVLRIYQLGSLTSITRVGEAIMTIGAVLLGLNLTGTSGALFGMMASSAIMTLVWWLLLARRVERSVDGVGKMKAEATF